MAVFAFEFLYPYRDRVAQNMERKHKKHRVTPFRGRDYLKVGQIMEILRQRGVRLIAINDGVDSARGDDDFTSFRNIMNDNLA